MEINKLKRDNKYVKDVLYIKDKVLYTKTETKIFFPKRYVNRELSVISDTISVLGFIAIVVNDKYYSSVNLPAFIETDPIDITEIEYNNIAYYMLEYDTDIPIFNSTTVVRNETFLFDIFDEFFLKAKIPWWFSYEDLGNIFTNMSKYTGSRIGNNPAIMEVFTAVISRVPNDLKTHIRHLYNKNNKITISPKFVQMESVYYTFDNTTSRLVGSYSQDGITASLVDPAENTERIEKLLRT